MGSAKPLMEAVFGTDGYVAQGLSAARAEATRAARGRTNIARDDTFFFFWGKERRKSGSFRGSCWVYILLGAKKKKKKPVLICRTAFLFQVWSILGAAGCVWT